MLSSDIMKHVRNIEIRTKKLVNDLFSGEYHSAFKGQGIEFADIREYSFGDDIRNIDWNVTAKTGIPFIKEFVEERELSVLFLVDQSGSQKTGSGNKLKSEITAEISALLAFSAIKNKDKISLALFTNQIEKFIPLDKGTPHVLRIIREILYFEPAQYQTDLTHAFEFAQKVLKRRAVIFIISDFQDAGYEKSLKLLSQYHDVVAIHIRDNLEKAIPKVGYLHAVDPETGEAGTVSTQSNKFQRAYQTKQEEIFQKQIKQFRRLNIDSIEINASEDYIKPLMNFFSNRIKRSS